MDSYFKNRPIGQDQPDRQDIVAFGRRQLAAGEKIPLILFILSKKTKIESNPHVIDHPKFYTMCFYSNFINICSLL